MTHIRLALVVGIIGCMTWACGEPQNDSSAPSSSSDTITTQQELSNSQVRGLRQALYIRGYSRQESRRIARELNDFMDNLAYTPSAQTSTRAVDRQLHQQLASYGGTVPFTMPSNLDLAHIPQDPNSPLSQEKILLGALLFHETGIGVMGENPAGFQTYSCASCHFADAGFQANRRQAIGDGGVGFASRQSEASYGDFDIDVQPIRSPATLNTAYQELMLWNGQFGATGDNAARQDRWTVDTPKETNFLGFEGLETQAIAAIDIHRQSMDQSLLRFNNTYQALFDVAFPLEPAHLRISNQNAALAIAAYERATLANHAPFQRWLRGDHRAMTKKQVRGAKVFFGKGNCVACHTGPALSSMTFHALAMPDLTGAGVVGVARSMPETWGRGGFTGVPGDFYKFKTPQLYNMRDSPFYGHGGNFNTIKEVIEYKNLAIPARPQVPPLHIAAEFVPLNLTNNEVNDLTAFLEDGLHDPNLNRYQPTDLLPSGLCTPHNDALSRIELGCD